MSENCLICKTELTTKPERPDDGQAYECPRCGKYFMSTNTEKMIRGYTYNEEDIAILSYSIQKMQRQDSECLISPDVIKAILKKTPPSLNEQINNIILWIGQTARPGEEVTIDIATHLSIAGAINRGGFDFVLEHLHDRGLIEYRRKTPREIDTKLLFDGWEYYRALEKGAIDSRKAFMAMKYGDAELDKIVEDHFTPAIAETGFTLYRLDGEPKAGLIDDRLRVEIRNSRFLISDLTHDNYGAYWEAGYAEGLGKPVIYTCKKEKFDEDKTHFDTNHHLTVPWDADNIEEAVKSLKATIRATLPGEAKMSDD